MIRPLLSRLILCLCLFSVGISATSFGRSKVSYCEKKSGSSVLATVQIVDRNGMAETISHPDRLKSFKKVDFLKPQPYQKVVRIYARNKRGEIYSFLTSYHENGVVKQYLEAVNGRAHGLYREWHSNGAPSLVTTVINGMADLSPGAERSWLFDGTSTAYDDAGNLIAEISYRKGDLEGPSVYYHKNGKVWKQMQFQKNQLVDNFEIYYDSGELMQTAHYAQGIKEGASFRFWANGEVAAKEEFLDGKLLEGSYYDARGEMISAVTEGNGLRAIFGRNSVSEIQEYTNGVLEGQVLAYSPQGVLVSRYAIKNGMKHGEEIEYFPSKDPHRAQPRLSIHWHEDRVHGAMRSWYENGMLESQREMANNEKNGLLTGWYADGSLMMIEEYEHDKLIKGEYYKKGEKEPLSQVFLGQGIATFFDASGNFLEKVSYFQGKPYDDGSAK